MSRKVIINILFVLILSLTTIVALLSVQYLYSCYCTEDDKLIWSFGWIFAILFAAPIYLAEFDVYYAIKYFWIRKVHKHKALAVINVLAMIVSISMVVILCVPVIAHFLNVESPIDGTKSYDILVIYIWSYIALRIVYCIINYYAVRDMLMEKN